jgi:hypothetical protein
MNPSDAVENRKLVGVVRCTCLEPRLHERGLAGEAGTGHDDGAAFPADMKLPATMRAAALDRFGGADVLTPHSLPLPTIGPGEVLIAVHTAGVGGWDADMRDGWSPDGKRPPLPLILGTDGSGTIAAVGSRVRRFAPGDIVYAYGFANARVASKRPMSREFRRKNSNGESKDTSEFLIPNS